MSLGFKRIQFTPDLMSSDITATELLQDDLEVLSVFWVDLPGQDLTKFDVVVLSDVPDITSEQATA